MDDEFPKISARVVAVYGKDIKVYYSGAYYDCSIRGKLLQTQLQSSPIAVGDNVEIIIHDSGKATIEKVLPRKQSVYRPDILGKSTHQVIATNLDQLIIVSSTQDPKFKPGLVDRFLVSAEIFGLPAVVIINKIDLQEPANYYRHSSVWGKLGYRVIFTSAKTREGIPEVIEILRAKTSTFAGHSGVGKSSLLNAIQPDLKIRTREISKSSGRGVHTTTSVIMYPLDFGGWVADTPGLKIFGLVESEKTSLQDYFPEFAAYENQCKFTNCQHRDEPGCRIKRAVDEGEVAGFRYHSYLKLWDQLDT